MAVTLSNNVAINGGLHVDTWSPQLLFPAGTQNVWYDPGDINLTWRRNLVSYSEQFDNVAWQKNGVALTANAAIAPNNTLTAYALMETAVSDTHRVYQTTNNPNNKTTSVYAKANGRNWFRIECSGGNASVNAFFNLTTGTLGTVTAGVTATITPVGDGWYLCTAYFATHSGTVFCCSANGDNTYSYIGDATRGVYIWGAQLELGSTATAYQSITDGFVDYYSYVANPPVMFQDSTGTTVTARVEQPVGLMLDKSQGLALGSEYITNAADREFTSDTGFWSKEGGATISGGFANINNVSGTYTIYRFNFPNTSGGYVEVSFDLVLSAGAVQVIYGTATSQAFNTSQRVVVRLNRNAVGTFGIRATGGGTALGTIDNISIKPVLGNHASQSTSTSRPVLRARYNLLTYSEAMATSYGTFFATLTNTPLITTPSGAPTSLLTPSTVSNAHGINYLVALGSGTFTYSFEAKANGYPRIGVRVYDGTAYRIYATIDISSGTVVGTPTGTVTITDLGSGWWRISIVSVASTGNMGTTTGWVIESLPAANTVQTSFIGDGVSGAYLSKADIRYGSSAGTYQRTSASTYSTTGTLDYDPVGQKPYLWFDGTDDSLLTSSINFSNTNKMFVCAGVTKLSDATAQIISELSASSSTGNNGSFAFISALSPSNYAFYLYGTSLASRTATTYTAPTTDVLSASYDISATSVATEIVPRIDGLTPTLADAGDAGTGNFGNYPLYIGRRNNASLPFTGLLYNLMIIGTQVDPVNIGKAEKFVADRTGITI